MDDMDVASASATGFAVLLLFYLLRMPVGAAKDDSAGPIIYAINKLDIKSGDILVIKSSRKMSPDVRRSIEEQVSGILPAGARAMVIDESLDIDSVLKCESTEVEHNEGESK